MIRYEIYIFFKNFVPIFVKNVNFVPIFVNNVISFLGIQVIILHPNIGFLKADLGCKMAYFGSKTYISLT